jgi:hypothetical protein
MDPAVVAASVCPGTMAAEAVLRSLKALLQFDNHEPQFTFLMSTVGYSGRHNRGWAARTAGRAPPSPSSHQMYMMIT